MKRVLVDRHHAGLFHSLQLLGDRLGWEVYTPVGYSWFDEGYWSFGREHLGRALADQYLNVADAAWHWDEGGYVTHDPEFPDRLIRGVVLSLAKELRWDFIVATVQENQTGFRRFADEVGARYVLQVGNTGQDVDWSLDPLALVSSEMPILGRGVRYHQEMSPVFAWRPPDAASRTVISSFVNCMPRIECWPLLVAAYQGSPDLTFRVYGIDGPHGVVKPASAIADLMAASGWGWHDKVTGDGFGHVIHGWAAIGRPLIGHASHYAGKMGEVFWQDGVTCIDLDRHTVAEAMEIVRTISPQDHARMCWDIHTTFRTIDHAAEARAIAELLT